jgi:hypothetical protein
MSTHTLWDKYFDVEWNLDRHLILLKSLWFYEWSVWSGLSFQWNASDKALLHNTFERQIMSAWSQRLKFKITGNGEFAKKYQATGLDLDFDIKRMVGGRKHWKVRVWKLPPNVPETSKLYQEAWPMVKPNGYIILNDKSVYRRQPITAPHEFGHVLFADDEYWRNSKYVLDTGSIMNAGTDLRGRHLVLLTDYLQRVTRWKFEDESITFTLVRR